MTRAMSFWMAGLLALLPLGFSAQAADVGVTMLHKMDFEAVMAEASNALAPVDLGAGGRAFPMSTNAGVTFNASKVTGWNSTTEGVGGLCTGPGFRFRNASGLGCSTATGWTITFFAKPSAALGGSLKGVLGCTIGPEGAEDTASLNLNVAIGNGGYVLKVTRASTSETTAEQATLSVTDGENKAASASQVWHHYAIRCVPAGSGQPTFELWQDGVKQGTMTIACVTDGTWVMKEFIMGAVRADGHVSTDLGSNSAYEVAPPAAQFMDEVALFDRPLSPAGLMWLKDHPAEVPPSDVAVPRFGVISAEFRNVGIGNAKYVQVNFGSSEMARVGMYASTALQHGAKLEGATIFFRENSTDTGDNGNALRMLLLNGANEVLGVSDAAVPTPQVNTKMTASYTFATPPAVDLHTAYKICLTNQEVAVGDTFDPDSGIDVRYLLLKKSAYGEDFNVPGNKIWVPAMNFRLRANAPALNVNFTKGESPLVEGTDYGVVPYPAAQWRSVTSDGTDGITITQDVTDSVGATVSLTAKARLIESSSAGTAYPLFRDTLMDSDADASAVSVELTGIPYKHYDLYVYMAAPTGVNNYFDKNGPVFLNDDTSRYYYMEADQSTASVSATPTSWGSAQDSSWGTAVIGTNVLRIADLTDEQIKVTAHRMDAGAEARGAITAIQVVEVPTNGLAVWSATLTGDHLASTQPFTNTRGKTKLLGELTENDCAEVTVAGAATLTLDAAAAPGQLSVVGGGTLTLAGAQTLTTEIALSEGTLAVTAEAAALEGCTITVAEAAVLAPRTTVSALVTGAGSVTIEAGQTGALANTANDFVGGTMVAGTLLWQGAAAYSTGTITVNAGGVFDLNGLPCAQAVTLAGGTLKGAFDAATDTIPSEVFSVNFNQDQGKVGDSETGGLVAMRGSYWVNSASASGTNQALTLVPYDQIAVAGASTQTLANALSWTCRGHWANGNNQTSYLKGYLDENSNIPVVLTFSLPEEKVKFGWDLYLYANTDTGGATFSAKDLIGDDGVTTSYTYSNGALVTGSTAGFGNSNTGTETVAEGVNVLKVPGLLDRSLRVNSPNRDGRGCIAAVQGVFNKPNGYFGVLTVTADSVLEAPEAGKALRLGYATVSGSGKLTKRGAGELRVVKSTFGAQTLAVAEGTCTVGEGNALESLNVTVGLGTTFAAEAGMESLAVASLAGAGTVELGDLTALTFTGSGAGTASFTGEFTATTRTVAAEVVCVFIKQGANTQQLAQLPTLLTFEIQAQAGTLKVNAATAQTLKRLVTTGGTFATDGVGEASVDFAQMASGAVNFTSRATAKSARPAMESAGDATVSRFTLAEGGTILYYSRADLAKYFPAGFIPEGEYTVQLGADLYSELSYPAIFTVMGAPATARFTVLTSAGKAAPSDSWSASGNTITIKDSSAITGTVEVLGKPMFHYTFDRGNLDKADDVEAGVGFNDENCTYADSDNGQCLASGTPWSGGFRLESGAWTFGTYFRLKAAQEKDVVFGFGQAGTAGALYLTKGVGNTVTLWHNPTGSGVVELFTVPLAGSSETWNHLLLVHTEGTITCYVNGVQLAVAKGDFAKTLTQFQVGSFHGGVGHGFTKWAGHDGQVDDLAVWSSALVGRQVTQAAAKVMGHWRWREGETPTETLDVAAADWQDVKGTPGSWPGTADDSNYTAAVSITASATLEELVEAMASFPAREVLWEGAALTFTPGATALTLPAGSPRLAVANEVVVDLAGVGQKLLQAAYAGQVQVTLADGFYSGEVTLRNAPEGISVTVVSNGNGLVVQPSLETPITGGAYARTLTGDANWNEAGAWTNLADGTTVDVLPAGATVFLTVTADATLTMGSERPELADLFVDGAGALTLNYGNLGLAAKADYANAPFERTLLTSLAGLPENLTIRTSALNYGAYATIAYTETAVVATVNAPEGLWQESGTERIISINFADAEANKVTGTALEGLAGYEVHAALWSQFVGTSQTGQTVNAYDYADRTNGSAAAVATGMLTYTTGTVWKTTAVDANARGLFKGYLDDNGSNNWASSTLSATVVLPADWSARYTAILYKAADTNLDKTKFTAALINGVWYSYVNEVLTSLVNFPANALPGAEYDWGSPKARQEYTAGTNVMVVSGLSGQTFTTEKWASRGAWTSFDARGGLAAIQLKEERSVSPGEAKTFIAIAEASGNNVVRWADLTWRNENGDQGTGAPTATDAATIVLTGDLNLNLSGMAVKHLTICGNGHAVSFNNRTEATVGSWAFVNDTVLELKQGEALPANTVVYPKRVRYAYPYEGDMTTTDRYEQEFAAGYTGALTPQGGLVEFSNGAVHFTGLPITATETDLIFSGDTVVTLADGVPFSFGTANLTFKDNAKVTAKVMRLCDEGPARTVNLAMTDDATITITGNVNDSRGNNSLLWPHWAGTLNASLRDRAKVLAEQAVMVLGVADADTLQGRLTLADDAEVRVAGLYGYGSVAATSYDINLKGGKLLIGSRGGVAQEGIRPISLNFQGGTFGAWQDVEMLGDPARQLFTSVTGNPLFAGEATMIFTSPEPFFTDTAARAILSSGGLVLRGKDFAALPSFQVLGGQLTLAGCAPEMGSLTLSGGSLELDAAFPTVSVLSIPVDTIIHLPLREKLAEGGYITMANGRQIPALTHAVFELALDPDRSETSRVLPLVPLVLGGYTEGTEPQVKGFGVLNNTNSAISDYAAVFRSGSAGRGLYAELTGNEVLKEHTVHLNAATEALEGGGYPLLQSTLNAYPYHIFSGELANAKILVPAAGVALPHAAFIGNPIRIVAQGSTPGVLLQGINYTFSTDVTFDLSAWAAAMPNLVCGAIKGVPASICLMSGGAVKAPASVRLKVDFGSAYTLPAGVEASVETTAQGVYYVLRYERRARTLSVNFTDSTVPLVSPPVQVGAYALPIAGWNSLEGVFSSATLKVSDMGGVAQEVAMGAADPAQSTQLLCYTSQTNLAPSASTSLLQVRLDDSTEQQLRLVNLPFAAYRVALIFANDLEGAAYATATINGNTYAMDAEGYPRRDITGYTALDAQGNPVVSIPADTQWGSTDFTPASAPVTLGANALVSDVLTAQTVTVKLPGFTYAQRYAGLAALQILEAPGTDAVGQILTCTYTFPADGDYELAALTLGGSATTWENGPENTLVLTSDHAVTLTLPKSFEADRIICSGSGTIALRVEGDGGAALRELDAEQLANVTVDFPAAGLVFTPANGTSRFEQSFDNGGSAYTIAEGATLALGEHSGIVTEFDDNGTATLDIDEVNSRGTLRRDYPVTQTSNVMFSYLTFAFKDGTATRDPNNSAYSLVVEEGDTFRHPNRFHLQNSAGRWAYTQTGGQASFGATAADQGGMLLFNNGAVANGVATITITGNSDTRLDATMIWAWKEGTRVNISVGQEATLALGSKGLRINSGASRQSITFTATRRGTLEAKDATLEATAGVTTTFDGGRLTTKQTEANFTLPMVFTGTDTDPTIVAPERFSTIVLSGANSGEGKMVVEQGTLAIANASALGSASVTVKAGATFESRNFASGATLSGKVSFASGSTCSATTTADVSGGYTARIAGTLDFPDGLSTVTFRLNGTAYTVLDSDVNAAAGTVAFRAGAQQALEDLTWNVNGPGGEWAEGGSAPWMDNKTYWNGARVSFPAGVVGAERTVGPIAGYIRPGSFTMQEGLGDGYHFTTDDGILDLRDCVASDGSLDLGSGTTFDVPIALDSPSMTLKQGALTLRLLGVMSNNYKTASLLSSDNVNGTTHGVWGRDAYNNDITWSPHAGETQRLAVHENQLTGGRKVTIAGQVADDGSVSGGTVEFAGNIADSNWNGKFSGTFEVRDGATLDFTMTQGGDNKGQGNDPFFRGISLAGRADPVFTLCNGATLRFSKCRNILGGINQATTQNIIESQPYLIGYHSTLDFAYTANNHQILPFGVRFNGDGAKMVINDPKTSNNNGMFVSRGATFIVSGIGEAGDLADPATDTASAPTDDTYGKLTRGITAIIDARDNTGLVRLDTGINGRDDITFQVGEGSTLRLLANLTHPGSRSSDTVAFYKTGLGRLTLEYPTIAARNTLLVKEGTLGGSAELTHVDSAITVAAGTTIEGGLRVPTLTIGAGATLALDATGVKPLRCDRALFTPNATVTVASLLPEGEIPSAANREPVKVMSWGSAQSVDSVDFRLDAALVNAGYGLEVRDDGLYLMRNVVYVRELSFEGTPNSLTVAWFEPNGWYREEDPATKRDFDPAENETATALFLLPADLYTAGSEAPQLTLLLTREANFSAVRVGVKVTEQDFDEEGNPTTREVIRPLQASITYLYDLTNEALPSVGEAYAFTWVSTRLVEGPDATTLAAVTASIPAEYAYTLLDATVVVYASATTFTPALNLNFTGKTSGDPAWVSLDAGNCGAVPYAGVYWNNFAVNGGSGTELVAEGADGRMLLRAQATVAGVTAEDGEAAACEVSVISSGAETVVSRRGEGNVSLSASFLKGQGVGNDTELLTAGGFSAPGVDNGWQVQVKNIPFANYDLYLLFAGSADGEVVYPAVRIKVGSNDWRTYSVANGFVAPADRTDVWRGRGSLVLGTFVNASNMLHLRLSSAIGESLEICGIDGQLGTPGSVGLAALQIVQCTDGVANVRLGTGNWSDPAGWARETSGGQQTGRWIDATDEALRWASIPTTSYLTADMVATTPFLRITGGSDLRLNGSEGLLSTGTVDLYNALAGARVTFEKNLFAAAPNVVMAPNITVRVPESDGSATCDFRWVYDDVTRSGTASTEATLQKTQSGELTLTRKNLNKLQIDDGTLWLSTTADGDYTRATPITGQGILGKTGIGRVTIAGNDMQLEGVTGVHVSQGSLLWALNTRVSPNGQRHIVDGGTLIVQGSGENNSSVARMPNAIIEVSNGGVFSIRGTNGLRTSVPTTIVNDGGTVESFYNFNSVTTQDHTHTGPIVLRNGKVSLVRDGSAWWWAYKYQGLVVHGELSVESGADNAITITNPYGAGEGLCFSEEGTGLTVAAGATLTSHVGITGVNLSGDVARKFSKRGPGTWIQLDKLAGPNREVLKGVPIDVEGGTFSYRIGGAEHSLANDVTDATITIFDGARLEGDVAFPAGSPIVIEEGGTLAPYVPGVAGSSITVQNLTLRSGAILEFDLANTTGGSLKNAAGDTVSFLGNLTVRLVNLPTTLSSKVQLTHFAASPSGIPTLFCPEAVALDAAVELEADDTGIYQLFLVPSGTSYTWADQDGKWSDAAWQQGGEPDKPFPGDLMSEGTPPARIQASSWDVTLAVDKGSDSLSALDGKDWAMTGLVLSAAANRKITLTEDLSTFAEPLPGGIALNRLLVKGAVWKLGAGEVTVSAPIAFHQAGDGSLSIAASTLKLTHPLLVQQLVNDTDRTTVPVPIDIAEGATLDFALAVSEAEGKVIAAQNPTYTPTAQTLSGDISGSGTLRVSGAKNKVTLTGSVDNSLVYDVTGSDASLILKGNIPETTPGPTRTVTVAAGSTLAVQAESALGWSPWAAKLKAAATDGAQVSTLGNARFRGSVEVTGTGTTTFGSAQGYLDGTTTFTVPEGATLALGGSWQSPDDTAATATLTKRGAGTLAITGFYESNLPLTVAEGTVEVATNGSIGVSELNPAIKADWTLASGATLRLGNGSQVNLSNGSLLVSSGATLDLAEYGREVIGAVTLQNGAVIRIGENGTLGNTTFRSAVNASGTIWVNLDSLDPATFGTSNTSKTSYNLLTFEMFSGTGIFRLGGAKQVEWAKAGWTLRTTASAVILESFGGSNGVYTWAGKADQHAWADPVWVLYANEANKQRRAWPSAEDVQNPYVAFLDKVTVANSDNVELEEAIPEAARTIDWDLPAQTLGGLRCANDALAYTLTAKNATAKTLSVKGEFLKTGEGALVIQRPLELGADGALKLLGGITRLEGSLSSASGDFKKPLTLAGGAELAFNYISGNAALGGLFTGDGTGTLRFSSTGNLTVSVALDGLKTLAVDNGTAALTAAGQTTLAPEVQLADGATLAYNPTALAQGGAVKLLVNPAASTPAGTLSWGAEASNETAKAPRLSVADGASADVPSVNVAELRYAPASGHLVLDPGHAVLPASAKLTLSNNASVATAFWMGADTAQGATFDYAGLTGTGLMSVEPVIDPAADASWRTTRTFTLALDPASSDEARTFRGTFAGALTAEGERIDAALTVQNAATDPASGTARFVLAGSSESTYLGPLTIGERTRVDVTGSWFGPVTVNAAGGELGGSGTVASGEQLVKIPAGGLITASAIGPRAHANGSVTTELIPTKLTIGGTLSMEPGSKLRVVIRNNAQEASETSCIQTERLLLPSIVDDPNNEVKLQVVIDDEADAFASNAKILGWNTIDGAGKINGTILDVNGNERTDYVLRQKSDGLYLYRSASRFWMILR